MSDMTYSSFAAFTHFTAYMAVCAVWMCDVTAFVASAVLGLRVALGRLNGAGSVVPELVAASKHALEGMAGGRDDAQCHRGICARADCLQCRRVDDLRAAIKRAEAHPPSLLRFF